MPKRRQSVRQATQAKVAGVTVDTEVIAKRTKRHLDELEKSNYSEAAGILGGDDDEEDGGGRTAKGRARHTISDKLILERGKKKKSAKNIRDAIIYKKSFGTYLEDADLEGYPSSVATYLTAAAPPPTVPPRMICTVCGYWGRYLCMKCRMAYCDKNCQDVHDETRCERRVI